ncbi:MAG: serine protease [bacterium]
MQHSLRRSVGLIFSLLAVSVLLSWSGCGKEYEGPVQPEAIQQEVVLGKENPQVQAVMAVQERHTERLMANPNVVGTGTGMTEDGKPAVVVMLKSEIKQEEALSKTSAIPAELEGVPVVIMVTGAIKSLKGGPGGGGFDPTLKYRPAPNGVSLGHFNITAGTLGCLVTDGSTTYILSNNHVMADENQAEINENILQPGPFDGGANPGDAIATLSQFEPIVFSTSANNVIDAAISEVDPGDVTGVTADEGNYGAPSSATVAAAIGMDVQKCGRTTGCTSTSTNKPNEGVTAINATVNVGYSTGTARFINQIVITKRSFSAGGDSGSLVVDLSGNPVGLLFAGGSNTTIANPIGAVLTEFGVTIIGD